MDAQNDITSETLRPAAEMARGIATFPGESPEHLAARTALLAEEIELRRHIERVAAQRRALPPGPVITAAYRFVGEDGRETDLAGLFGDKTTLVAHSYMFGPQRARPCPMCTDMLDGWNAIAPSAAQRLSLIAIARSPIERLVAWKQERGWKHLRLYCDITGDYSRDMGALTPDGGDDGMQNVFVRDGAVIRRAWASAMNGEMADPGQDQRGAPDPSPLWHVFDLTPEGRAPDWYPQLSYGS